jgi:hypothetical protein
MPTINLDSILNTGPTWDLSVTIGGKQYKIRPMSAKDIEAVVMAGPVTDAESAKIVKSWFDGESPDVSDWRTEMFSALFTTIAAYYQHNVVSHRTNAINAAVRLATGMR